MRTQLGLVLILTLAPLAGCLTITDDTDSAKGAAHVLEDHETDNPLQPAAGNNRLFAHADGPGGGFLSTDANASKGEVSGAFVPLSQDTWFSFTLKPAPTRSLNLSNEAATVTVNFQTSSLMLGLAPKVKARVYVDDDLVGEGSQANHFGGQVRFPVGALPDVAAGATVRLDLCVCAEPTTLLGSYTINADGRTWLELPIETPVWRSPVLDEPGAAGAGGTSSEVTVKRQGNGYVATKVVTYSRATSDVSKATVDLSTGNGGVSVTGTGDKKAEVVVTLEGRGSSEQAARDRLSKLSIDHTDPIRSGTLEWSTHVRSADRWQNQSGRIEMRVQSGLEITELEAKTGNGGMSMEDLDRVGTARLDTGNGGVDVDSIAAASLTVDTGNGGVDITNTKANDVLVDTGNGRIEAEIEPKASGRIELNTGNGGIDLRVPDGASYGYDAEAETGNGGASIDLADAQDVGQQRNNHKHVRTSDYDSRSIRVEIVADSGNGGVDIQGD